MGKHKSLEALEIGLKTAGKDTDVEAPSAPTSEVAKYWAKELTAAREREKTFRKKGYDVVRLYEADAAQATPFNILYSNTETLLPVLYSQVPRPVVRRRQRSGGKDLKSLLAARVTQRLLEYFLDDGLGESPGFDELAQRSCLQALVAGRGMMRFRYNAEFEVVEQPVEGGEPGATEKVEQLQNEYISAEYVEWDRVLFGYARVWKQVPWLAFELIMSRAELIEHFGERLGRAVPLTMATTEESAPGEDSENEQRPPADSKGAHLAQVYEIWDKVNKKVIFYAPDYNKEILKELDDPLGLTNFFPCAEPLTLFLKVRSLVPQQLYVFYEQQAEELNRVTVRINKIISALKVRGFYDSTLKNLDQLMNQEDNILLPAENVATMIQGQTLDKAIWLMPLEKLIVVLQQLYAQRNQVKTLIYEITGISDVLRGASAASETLGAQEMKQTWATIRIKRMQKAVMKYLRNNLRVMAELALTKLPESLITQMTGIMLPTEEDKAKAQAQLQAYQMAQVQAQAQSQPSGPGLPPALLAPSAAPVAPQKPLDPMVQQTLQTPTMAEVLEVLHNDLQRSYYIDIETNSTLESEATEDKQQVGEFLNALAQFMSGIAPLIQTKVMPFEAAQTILINVTRRYRMGDEVEEALQKMQPPQMPEDDKGKAKDVEGEKALMQAKIAAQEEDLRLKKELGQIELSLKRMEMALEQEKMQLERQMAEQKMQLELRKMQHKQQLNESEFQLSLAQQKQRQLLGTPSQTSSADKPE